jgi:hypothetical protein
MCKLTQQSGQPKPQRTDSNVDRIRTNGESTVLSGRGWGGVDWIGLAQDRDKWRALVNLVMNLWVP